MDHPYDLEYAAGFKAATLRNRRQTFDNFCSQAKVSEIPRRELTLRSP